MLATLSTKPTSASPTRTVTSKQAGSPWVRRRISVRTITKLRRVCKRTLSSGASARARAAIPRKERGLPLDLLKVLDEHVRPRVQLRRGDAGRRQERPAVQLADREVTDRDVRPDDPLTRGDI